MSNEGLNADAEREAEFWRAHPRGDAWPDKSDLDDLSSLPARLRAQATWVPGVNYGRPYQVMVEAAAALEQAGKELKRLREELEDAEDRRGNEYLKLEDTVAEQAAALEAAAVELLAAKEQSVRWFFRFGGALNDIAARDATIAAALKTNI